MIFWMGDLNYRVECSREEAIGLLQGGRIEELYTIDQVACPPASPPGCLCAVRATARHGLVLVSPRGVERTGMHVLRMPRGLMGALGSCTSSACSATSSRATRRCDPPSGRHTSTTWVAATTTPRTSSARPAGRTASSGVASGGHAAPRATLDTNWRAPTTGARPLTPAARRAGSVRVFAGLQVQMPAQRRTGIPAWRRAPVPYARAPCSDPFPQPARPISASLSLDVTRVFMDKLTQARQPAD